MKKNDNPLEPKVGFFSRFKKDEYSLGYKKKDNCNRPYHSYEEAQKCYSGNDDIDNEDDDDEIDVDDAAEAFNFTRDMSTADIIKFCEENDIETDDNTPREVLIARIAIELYDGTLDLYEEEDEEFINEESPSKSTLSDILFPVFISLFFIIILISGILFLPRITNSIYGMQYQTMIENNYIEDTMDLSLIYKYVDKNNSSFVLVFKVPEGYKNTSFEVNMVSENLYNALSDGEYATVSVWISPDNEVSFRDATIKG